MALRTLFLGILQGITEFLPISSSGHLVVINDIFFNLDFFSLAFLLVVHLATLLVVLVYFRKKLVFFLKKENISKIIVAFLATSVMTLFLKKYLLSSFASLKSTALLFLVTGVCLFLTRFKKREKGQLNLKMATIIGILQGFAIFPGISRSGITIAGAILLGLKSELAFEFSFMLSIPTIIAASFYELLASPAITVEFSSYFFLGFAGAFFAGLLAIFLLFRILRKGKLYYFAYYCWALGIAILILI